MTTGADGKITVDDLPDGEYQLVEIKAPTGYQLSLKPITVIISQNNNHTATTVVKDMPITSSSSFSSKHSSSSMSSVKKQFKYQEVIKLNQE